MPDCAKPQIAPHTRFRARRMSFHRLPGACNQRDPRAGIAWRSRSLWRRSNRLNPAPAAPEPRHSVRGPEQRAARPAWSPQGPRTGARSAPAKRGMRSVDRSARTAPLGARDALPPVEAPLRWVDRRGDAATVLKGRRGVEAQMSAVTRADQLHRLGEIVRDGEREVPRLGGRTR